MCRWTASPWPATASAPRTCWMPWRSPLAARTSAPPSKAGSGSPFKSVCSAANATTLKSSAAYSWPRGPAWAAPRLPAVAPEAAAWRAVLPRLRRRQKRRLQAATPLPTSRSAWSHTSPAKRGPTKLPARTAASVPTCKPTCRTATLAASCRRWSKNSRPSTGRA